MKNQYEIDYQQGYDKANEEWIERIDKIRAEIIELRSRQNVGVLECLDIIDKHMTEIKTVANVEEAEAHPINENITKGFEEFTKMMFRQGQGRK